MWNQLLFCKHCDQRYAPQWKKEQRIGADGAKDGAGRAKCGAGRANHGAGRAKRGAGRANMGQGKIIPSIILCKIWPDFKVQK